jgi:AraC-like DNA-binding protein
MTESVDALIEHIKILTNEIRIQGMKTLTPPSNDLEHYTIEEVSEILHCSPNSVRNILKDNEIKTFKYKSIVRVKKSNLERFINRFTI